MHLTLKCTDLPTHQNYIYFMCIIIIIIASPYVQDKWGLNLSVTLYFKVQFLLLKNINYDFASNS